MLERGSIDKPLTVDVGLIQLSFHTVCSPNACKCVFNPNVTIFQANFAEGLHFSDFHLFIYVFYLYIYYTFCLIFLSYSAVVLYAHDYSCTQLNITLFSL